MGLELGLLGFFEGLLGFNPQYMTNCDTFSRRLRRLFRKFWSEMLKNRKKAVKSAKQSAQSAGKKYHNLFLSCTKD
jgi:hypothetical protein